MENFPQPNLHHSQMSVETNPLNSHEVIAHKYERLGKEFQTFLEQEKFTDLKGDPVKILEVIPPGKEDIELANEIQKALQDDKEERFNEFQRIFLEVQARYLSASTMYDSIDEGKTGHDKIRRPIETVLGLYAAGLSKDKQPMKLTDTQKKHFEELHDLSSTNRLSRNLMLGSLSLQDQLGEQLHLNEESIQLHKKLWEELNSSSEYPDSKYALLKNNEKNSVLNEYLNYVKTSSKSILEGK